MNEFSLTREYLMGQLHQNVLTISFTKKDGSNRQMLCTLKTDLLPQRSQSDTIQSSNNDLIIPPEIKTKKINESIIPVYDLEKKGWRSIIIANIIKIEIME